MSDDYRIPAANICDVDLKAAAARKPDAAREIARLGESLHRGEETKEEFRRLCTLLCDVGETEQAEYLLRRNIEYYEAQGLYGRLFGTAIPDDFAQSIAQFAEDFGVDLRLEKERGFLDQEHRSVPRPGDFARFNILDEECSVRFDYSRKDFVVAEVVAGDPDRANYYDLNTCLFLRWQNRQWRLIDPRDA